MSVCIHVCICMYMYVYIYIHIHMYVYNIYIYIYICVCLYVLPCRQAALPQLGEKYRTPEIDASEIDVDFRCHFPMDVQWHFPTRVYLSAVCSKGLSLPQWTSTETSDGLSVVSSDGSSLLRDSVCNILPRTTRRRRIICLLNCSLLFLGGNPNRRHERTSHERNIQNQSFAPAPHFLLRLPTGSRAAYYYIYILVMLSL